MSKKMTGYPSIDKPWLKYYKEGAEERANNIPKGKTVWDVIEEKLYEHIDIPAIEYFGRVISRKEFIDMVYTWARALKALGVKENEVVPYYGPFFPDVGAMAFAFNMIGACPYFLKLAISPEALAEETKESRIAIVFEDMWQNVSCEFTKDRFEKVIIINAADGMSGSKKQIVSLLSKLKSKNGKTLKEDKYLTVKQAKSLAKTYTGEVKVPFVPHRPAFITSSSGTTVGGVVKGVVATNESVYVQVHGLYFSDVGYLPADRTLNHFPPTAATSLNSLFLLPLLSGATVIIDPRVTDKDFYNQLVSECPNVSINTATMWELFFDTIEKELSIGKKFDFSCAKNWMVGGEGASVKQMQKWNQIMKKCGAERIYGGFGCSETFSSICFEKVGTVSNSDKLIASAGLVQAGMTVGIFDSNGKELLFNQRGELWVKTKAAMKGYYNKPELTAQTKIDGWIHTGDLAEIDENGFVYIWGRVKDTVTDKQGNQLYLFDVAYKIKEKEFIDDAIVLPMKTNEETVSLVAHIVWNGNPTLDKQKQHIEELNASMKEYLPETISMVAYSVHDVMLPYSPTTLKKDKNRLSKQTDGYVQMIDGEMKDVEFTKTTDEEYLMIVK